MVERPLQTLLKAPGPPSIRVAVLAFVKASRKSLDRGGRTQIRNLSPPMPSSKPDAVPLPYPLKNQNSANSTLLITFRALATAG
jgi:hypothetical protein